VSDLNICTFIGRLGKDPESKSFSNGDTVVNFSIAVSESWKDKTSGEKKERTEWINIVAHKQLGEICAKYLTKGSQVAIVGKFRTRSYDKDGHKVYVTEIIADTMQMLGGKQDGAAKGGEKYKPAASQAVPDSSDIDGDILF
jgi:single-strand DNA-binding protein